jgi:hypothetical protein
VAQITLSGMIKNTLGKELSGVSIIISDENSDEIRNYGISNQQGFYQIKLNTSEKKIKVIVSILGYKTQSVIIENKTQILEFLLFEEIKELKEVIVRVQPLEQRGDTLSYRVDAFANAKDRTISDVLAKMPGIEVLPDGRILYQGKPINKYYIEGLDLLEGKYNLANKNLPFVAVSEVQILENHQPIKILDSLIFSDQAALNIKLKNKVAYTGQAELATGIKPILWKVNATPMLFTKKKQAIFSYQTNNTGEDINGQLKTLTLEEFIESFQNDESKSEWLSILKLNQPSFSSNRWLDNNTHLLTINYLQRLKKDFEVKLNLSYLNDDVRQNGSLNTIFYNSLDTVIIFETNRNRIFTNYLKGNLTLQKNVKSNYFKNSFEFQTFGNFGNGNIILNNQLVEQNLKNPSIKFSNKLKMIFQSGNKILTLQSFSSFNKSPQELVINPGQFIELLNGGNGYSLINQSSKYENFYTNSYIGFTKKKGSFSFEPKIGFQFETQILNSEILIDGNSLSTNFSNDLNLLKAKVYLSFLSQYKFKKWRVELNTPINYYNLSKDNVSLGINRVVFEPKINLIFEASPFFKFYTGFNKSNRFGEISNLYNGYILSNYRNIQRFVTDIPETINNSFNFGVNYKNTLNAVFGNINYTYTKAKQNLIFNSKINTNGTTEVESLIKDNFNSSQILAGRVGKYFPNLKTNLSIGSTVSRTEYQQFLNSNITPIKLNSLSINFKLYTDFADWIGSEYLSDFSFINNSLANITAQTINFQSHSVSVNLYPEKRHYLSFKTDYYQNNLFKGKSTNVFSDFSYRYTTSKKKIDFVIEWTNIFNINDFQTLSINSFISTQTNFRLRPSQILFKTRFTF